MTAFVSLGDAAIRRRIVWRTLGVAGAELSAVVPAVVLIAFPFAGADGFLLLAEMASEALMIGFGVTVVLELHERWSLRQGSRWHWLTVGGLLLVNVVASAATPYATTLRLGLIESPYALRLHNFWVGLFVGVIAFAYLTQRRESAQAEARTRQHELQLDLARRRLSDSTARAAQARLDPSILFHCLRDASSAYAVETSAGDLMLERLTTYLRAALAASTASANRLGQEAETASALIALQQRDRSVELVSSLSPAASACRFPPGVLVRLLGDWAAAVAQGQAGSPATPTITLTADRHATALNLRIQAPSNPPAEAVERCRLEVAEMLGAAACTLEQMAPGTLAFTMELNDEH